MYSDDLVSGFPDLASSVFGFATPLPSRRVLNCQQRLTSNKWFQFSSWRDPDEAQDAADGSPQPLPEPVKTIGNESRTTAQVANGDGFALSGSDLMGFEDVYRVAGIKSPKQGYSITKVIEMLQSEHIRSLGADTKRASLLMALEAAGIQVDEVLQDATLRQRAVNSYEAIQRKHLEEYEARKAQESCAIQAEMERVAAEYAARISNNLDEVSREKDNFRKWQGRKQQEAQKISEAVALCVTPGNVKAITEGLAPLREMASVGEKTYGHRG